MRRKALTVTLLVTFTILATMTACGKDKKKDNKVSSDTDVVTTVSDVPSTEEITVATTTEATPTDASDTDADEKTTEATTTEATTTEATTQQTESTTQGTTQSTTQSTTEQSATQQTTQSTTQSTTQATTEAPATQVTTEQPATQTTTQSTTEQVTTEKPSNSSNNQPSNNKKVITYEEGTKGSDWYYVEYTLNGNSYREEEENFTDMWGTKLYHTYQVKNDKLVYEKYVDANGVEYVRQTGSEYFHYASLVESPDYEKVFWHCIIWTDDNNSDLTSYEIIANASGNTAEEEMKRLGIDSCSYGGGTFQYSWLYRYVPKNKYKEEVQFFHEDDCKNLGDLYIYSAHIS